MNPFDNILKPDSIHELFGIEHITPNIRRFGISHKNNKKYFVELESHITIHFGDKNKMHYIDKLEKYKHLDHRNLNKRIKYLEKISKVKKKDDSLIINNIYHPNFYSARLLY